MRFRMRLIVIITSLLGVGLGFLSARYDSPGLFAAFILMALIALVVYIGMLYQSWRVYLDKEEASRARARDQAQAKTQEQKRIEDLLRTYTEE